MKIVSLGKALIKTIVDKNLAETVFDVAEITIQSDLIEGILKEVPIIGLLAHLAKPCFNEAGVFRSG